MFYLYTKCFLHELAIGILWLDKGEVEFIWHMVF